MRYVIAEEGELNYYAIDTATSIPQALDMAQFEANFKGIPVYVMIEPMTRGRVNPRVITCVYPK